MSRTELLVFMRSHRYVVQASVSPNASAQAAVVGVAVTDAFEIVFDTIDSTRKAANLFRNPRIAFVIGGWTPGDERTIQYEGAVDRPQGAELERLKEVYYAAFPEGRKRLSWPGIVYLRARPTWIRCSDFNLDPTVILELAPDQIEALR